MDEEKSFDDWDLFSDMLSANTWGQLGLFFPRLCTLLRKSKRILLTGAKEAAFWL